MILDTNALSAWAEGSETLRPVLQTAERLVVPSIVIGEYIFGIRQSRHRSEYEEWLRRNLPSTEIATVTYKTAEQYANIRLELKTNGTPIPSNDAWIAALAKQHDLLLVTNDSHFDRIDGLAVIGF